MANEGIKFGTDGWRGIIADDFTFDSVRRVGGAIASYILKNEEAAHGLVVGYDTRFASRSFAESIGEVLANAGIPIRLSSDYIPTSAVSFVVKELGCAGGVVITSSHNPWNWNGVKFKAKYGGSGSPAIMKAIEAELRADAMPRNQRADIGLMDFIPMLPAPVSNSRLTACMAPGETFWPGFSLNMGFRTSRFAAKSTRTFPESTLSPSSHTSRCCRKQWCGSTAAPDS
jgi:phosphomannomutase